MSKFTKKSISLFLCLILIFSSIIPVFAFSYPESVTKQDSALSIKQTDKLIENAVLTLKNQDLYTLLHSELYKDDTLSSLLTGIYSSLKEYGSVISMAKVDITPAGVSPFLKNYPEISNGLKKSDSWDNVNLKGLKWNVKSEKQFADAVASMLSPFNDLFYMLLCSGNAKFSILNLKGSNGYESCIVPVLDALGCKNLPSQNTFTSKANSNKSNMISQIIMSLFTVINKICKNPVSELTVVLPRFSYFCENGGLENAVNSLMSPLTLNLGNLKNIITSTKMLSLLMFISSPGKFSTDFVKNLHTVINDGLSQSGLKVSEINFTELAQCYNEPEQAYIVILRWLIDSLKLNTETLSQNPELKDFSSVITSLLSKSTDELTGFIISLFTATKGTELTYVWEDKNYTSSEATYTQNLGKEKFERVVDGIDGVIEEFIKASDPDATLEDTLKHTIYSNSLLTTLVKTVYGAFEDEKIIPLMQMLNIPVTPYGLSTYVKGNGGYVLSSISSFKNINYINWGFYDGDRNGFENRLTEILTPFIPLLDFLLANGTVGIFEGIRIGGSNGYETAVIPLLDAIGCKNEDIASYNDYAKNKGNKKIIELLLKPILNLTDDICEQPVNTVLGIIPNILFFTDNGSAVQCINNLLYPLNKITEELNIDLNSLGFNINELTQKDLIAELSKAVPGITDKIKLTEPNLKSLESFGILTEKSSKRTAGKCQYIESDKPALMITVLRYIVTQLKEPDNGNVLSDLMSSSTEGNEMFAMSSGSITDKFGDMSVDEIIEFLYKLLFRERAIEDNSGKDEIPTVIYKEKKQFNYKALIIAVLIIAVITTVCILLRKQIIDLFEIIKQKITDKTQRGNK